MRPETPEENGRVPFSHPQAPLPERTAHAQALPHRRPAYRLHKQSGQAIVTVDGRDITLGKHGTPESREKYNRLIAEWVANGRHLKPKAAATVAVLIAAYWRHAPDHYKGSRGELGALKAALCLLRRLYGETPAAGLGPLALKAVRAAMVAAGWGRPYVNARTKRLRRAFKRVAAEELAPPAVWESLRAVEPLRRGKTDAPEPEPVKPVAEEHVAATLAHVGRRVWRWPSSNCRPGCARARWRSCGGAT